MGYNTGLVVEYADSNMYLAAGTPCTIATTTRPTHIERCIALIWGSRNHSNHLYTVPAQASANRTSVQATRQQTTGEHNE